MLLNHLGLFLRLALRMDSLSSLSHFSRLSRIVLLSSGLLHDFKLGEESFELRELLEDDLNLGDHSVILIPLLQLTGLH